MEGKNIPITVVCNERKRKATSPLPISESSDDVKPVVSLASQSDQGQEPRTWYPNKPVKEEIESPGNSNETRNMNGQEANVSYKQEVQDPHSDGSMEQSEFMPQDYYRLVRVGTKKWRIGPIRETSYQVAVRNLPPNIDLLEMQLRLASIMESAFRSILQNAPQNAIAQIAITNPEFNKSGLSSCRMRPSELTFDSVTERLTAVLQSGESLKLEDTTFYLTTYLPNPTVGGVISRSEYNKEIWAANSRNFFDPYKNKYKVPKHMQKLCVAFVLARALHQLEDPSENPSSILNYVVSKKYKLDALSLIGKAGLSPNQAPFTLSQIKQFEKGLPPGVGVNFFTERAPPILRLGNANGNNVNIFLCYGEYDTDVSTGKSFPCEAEDGTHVPTVKTAGFHAFGMLSIQSFMDTHHYCYQCLRGYNETRHTCSEAVCQLCHIGSCTNNNQIKKRILRHHCEHCNLFFDTGECHRAHLSKCGENIKCKMCGERFVKRKYLNHDCGKPYCSICKRSHSTIEQCFVSKETGSKRKERRETRVIWYADTETQVHPETREHSANLLILQRCDSNEFVEFKGNDAMKKFVEACLPDSSQFKNALVVFHNGSGFDNHLWWRELFKAGIQPSSIIRKQQRIIGMKMRRNNIECRDSLQFLPGTPLAAFPTLFDLDCGDKGFFPHGLNTDEWVQFGQHLVYRETIHGQTHRFPPLKYFMPKHLKAKSLVELTQWHKVQTNLFDENQSLCYIPENKLVRYCRQDVRLLKEGFEKYRSAWRSQYPDLEVLESLTLPSLTNRVFREYYMPEEALAVLPPQGYEHKNQPQSALAMAYIAWMERELDLVAVRSARKGGEATVAGHRVDALGYKKHTGEMVILQFHGCYWHGHHCKERTPANRDWYEVRAEDTAACDKLLRQVSESPNSPYGPFELYIMFECEFQRNQDNSATLKSFVSEYLAQYSKEHLNPRSALRGGRTNSIKHRIIVAPGERLYYLDYNSLYPAVNFGIHGKIWPLGHPDIYIGKDLEVAPTDWFGLVKLSILPPRQLRHPVLGELVGDRFIFHLCPACAADKNQSYCQHSDKERLIHGVYFTGEIQLALLHGYKVHKVDELWHWPPARQSTTLFTGLIRDLYKIKALSSAIPDDPLLLKNIVKEYRQIVGLELDPAQFKPNPALRNTSKMAMNQIWGYFAKRNDQEETSLLKSYSEYLALENDPKIVITRTKLSEDEETILVSFRRTPEPNGAKGNVVLAAITTAYARIALYNLISKYPREVVYFDTDSVFLLLPDGQEPPETSAVLGGLKDEILDEFGSGAYITHFCSIGPKSYSYTVERDGAVVKSVVKMKGINFTKEAAEVVNEESMRTMVNQRYQTGDSTVLTTAQHLIRKDFFMTRLFNATIIKKIAFTSSKRAFRPHPNPTLDTLPYGFCQ